MRAIELEPEDMKEILNNLPDELRSKIINMIRGNVSDRQIERMKRFCSQYDAEDGIDGIIANTCAVLIDKIGAELSEQMRKNKKAGKPGMCGTDAGMVVARKLREEAEEIMKAVEKHKAENDGECPGHH